MTKKCIGLGSVNSKINFYIANRPPIDNYPVMQNFRALESGELGYIVKHTGNHWRKVFNVYAKLLFDWYQLDNKCLPENWQAYWDLELFQSHSHEALVFSQFGLNKNIQTIQTIQTIHIIAGKTYAAILDLPPLVWLDSYFAINKHYRLIVAPYPDYRQLSNERIAQLITLMTGLK